MSRKPFFIPGAALLAIYVSAAGIVSSSAAIDPTLTQGDLILGVQSSAVTSTVLEVNIGAPSLYKSNSSPFLIGNINSELVSLFGANWFDSPNLFFGVSGANNAGSFNAGTADANGDFNSTIYASRSRNDNGTVGFASSTPWSFSPSTATTAATPILQLNGTFDNNDVNGIALIPTSLANEWSDHNPVSGTGQMPAYASVFTTGIQFRLDVGTFADGTFAGLSDVEAVADLYRITRFSNGGSTPGVGSYIGSIAIERDGDIRYVSAVPEPTSTAFLAVGLASFLGWGSRRRAQA